MNSVNLIGRVGGDIELRYTPSGKEVCEINLAVDDGWGEHKKTVWVTVTVWGASAKLAAQAVRKGDKLGVAGRLSQDEWQDKTTGKKQTKIKVTSDSLTLTEPKRGDGSSPPARPASNPTSRTAGPASPPQPQAQSADDFDEDDDIPF